METHTVRHEIPGGFKEYGVVTHEGKDYASGGALVSDAHLVCYPSRTPAALPRVGNVEAWDGEVLGKFQITGYVPAFGGVRLTCYRVTLHDGREYYGRGLGRGMLLRCRRAIQKCPTCHGKGRQDNPRDLYGSENCGACGGSGKWWTPQDKIPV